MTMSLFLRRFARDEKGAMAIETGIVATALAMLSLGGYQVSSVVARQNELQIAAGEAAAIALAAKPDTTEKLATVETILMTSTGLPDANVTVDYRYKCGDDDDLETIANCDEDEREWKFVRVQLSQTYVPAWKKLGIGSNINLKVARLVQIQ